MLNYAKMFVFFSDFTKPGLFQARTFFRKNGKIKKFTKQVAVAPNSLLTGTPEPVFRDKTHGGVFKSFLKFDRYAKSENLVPKI